MPLSQREKLFNRHLGLGQRKIKIIKNKLKIKKRNYHGMVY
jgi:hypothetical protein